MKIKVRFVLSFLLLLSIIVVAIFLIEPRTTGEVILDSESYSAEQIAVFRPSVMDWFIRTENGTTRIHYGAKGDIPVPVDYNGDGQTDIAVYRPTDRSWHIRLDIDDINHLREYSYPKGNGAYYYKIPGNNENDIPVPADYDGDGKADIAVYNSLLGNWHYIDENSVKQSKTFGDFGDGIVPVPADYDGDGKINLATYKKDTADWKVLYANGTTKSYRYGWDKTVPVPADYDGDGKADIAVYNPKANKWHVREIYNAEPGPSIEEGRAVAVSSPFEFREKGQGGKNIGDLGVEEVVGSVGYHQIDIATDTKNQPHIISASPVNFFHRVGNSWTHQSGNNLGIIWYSTGVADISIDENDKAWYSGSYIKCAGCDAGNWMASIDDVSTASSNSRFDFHVRNTFKSAWDTGFVCDSDIDPNNPNAMYLWGGSGIMAIDGNGGRSWSNIINAGSTGGEKIAFRIAKRDGQAGIFHTSVGGCTGRCGCAKYVNSLMSAPVCWFDSFSYPRHQVDSDHTYVSIGTDYEKPGVAYLSTALNGLALNIWDGATMKYPTNGLHIIDSCVAGESANGGAVGRIQQGWAPAQGGGAFICWTHCDNHVYLKYITHEGEDKFGPTVDIGPGSQCAIATDSEGQIHMVYNNGGVKYRKIETY